MASPTRERNTEPLYDYSKLAIAESDAMPARERSSALDATPFPALYAESKRSGKVKHFAVPTKAAVQTEYLLRRAALRVKGGIHFDSKEGYALDDNHKAVKRNGWTLISFQAKEKKHYDPSKLRKPRALKQRKGESKAEFDKRLAEYNKALRDWEASQK